MIMEDSADTPRVCEACGGDKEVDPPCVWCSSGFQDLKQQGMWRKFRIRLSKISGTYSLFQGAIEEIIGKLDRAGGEEAQSIAIEGREVLCKWLVSDPGTIERDDAGRGLAAFYRTALDHLTKR